MIIEKQKLIILRVLVSTICFTILMLYFLVKGSILPDEGIKKVIIRCGEIISDAQIIPGILNIGQGSVSGLSVVLIISIITIIFGRIYCSGICPLGVLLDLSIAVGNIFIKQKFSYFKGKRIIWYSFLVFAIVCIRFGFVSILGFLDPFSLFGKIGAYGIKPLIVPVYSFVQNIFDHFQIFLLNPFESKPMGLWITVAVLITAFCLMFVSAIKGRLWCNVICPVGAFLGLLSKVSLLRIKISDSCSQCGVCEKICRGNCIDIPSKHIDHDRCVRCFDCLDSCSSNSISYRISRKFVKEENKDTTSRKQFLNMGIAATCSVVPFLLKPKLVFADDFFVNARFPNPPGAITQEIFMNHCTGCGLCIARCPTGVLRPAVFEKGFKGLMKPLLDFGRNSCEYKCKVCSEVCPTGAIEKLSIVRKQKLSIGKAKFVEDRCIVKVNNTACGACSEVCPTNALHMIKYRKSLTIPEIDETICIGCGACEFSCPVRPARAVFVTALSKQVPIGEKKPVKTIEQKSRKSPSEDFPF